MERIERPARISVIGTLFVVLGAFAAFCGVAVLAPALLQRGLDSPPAAAEHFGPLEPILVLLWMHMPWFAGGQVVLALVGIIGGIGLLRGRDWSRPLLMLLSWLALVGIAAWGVSGIIGFWSRPAEARWPVFDAVMTVIMLVMLAAFAAVPCVIIRLLGSDAARAYTAG